MVNVFITGVGSALAGLSLEDWFAGAQFVATADEQTALDRRKLRYKDRATALAIAACQAALDDAGILVNARIGDQFEQTGVVASSNFGNLETVCRTVERINAGGTADASPLDLPNASPNVISASVAIYFGAGAVNLTVTNGATSGLDALALAVRAIRAGRANRMIVVGTEASSDPLSRLLAHSGVAPEAAFEGAAALVLDRNENGGRRYARIDRVGEPCQGPQQVILRAARGEPIRSYPDPFRRGLAYGAMGVLQTAFAARAIQTGPAVTADIVTGGVLGDNARGAVISAEGR